MSRPRKYSTQEMIDALRETKGMIYLAAARLGCRAQTFYNRARSTPAVARLIQHERGCVVDTAELKLYTAILAGEPWAIQMTLKTLGKDRGYVERTEHREVTDAEIDAEIERELAALRRGGPAGPGTNGVDAPERDYD
jgi:hypothetical protein